MSIFNEKGEKIATNNTLVLSDQALGAVMLALQNSLLHQTDIVPVLKGFEFVNDSDQGLVVRNPPILRADAEDTE
tara:strand:- start:1163 stop:1387 length:225 start_codon:yes stop_codon:yes gene_type:complete